MMRINLLPVRAAKKKESIRLQVSIAALLTLLVAGLSGLVYFGTISEVAGLEKEIGDGKAELEVLEKKIGELAKIKDQKRVLEDKLAVVEKLDAQRTGPVEMFARISESIPDEVWLSSLEDRGDAIYLKGAAMFDDAVAVFMKNLERHKELGSVELEVAQRGQEKKGGLDLVSFVIILEKTKK